MEYCSTKFKDLSAQQTGDLKMAVHDVLVAIQRGGVPWPKLAADMDVTPEALGMFVQRGRNSGNGRGMSRKSETLAKAAKYVITGRHSFPGEVTSILELKREAFAPFEIKLDGAASAAALSTNDRGVEYERLVDFGYEAMRKMLHIPAEVYSKTCTRMSGTYLAYRYSIYEDQLLVSGLVIRQRPRGSQWEFRTAHWDNIGHLKSSDGVVMPLHDNVYLGGDIEQGQGLDVLVLRLPLQNEFEKIIGFHISIDNDRRPLFSRTILVRSDVPFDQIPPERMTVRAREKVGEEDKEGERILRFFKADKVGRVLRADARAGPTD